MPIEKKRAASRLETPPPIAAINRPQSYPLRLLVIFTSGQITTSSEPDNYDSVNPQTDLAVSEDNLGDRQKGALLRLPTSQADLLKHYTLSDEYLGRIR